MCVPLLISPPCLLFLIQIVSQDTAVAPPVVRRGDSRVVAAVRRHDESRIAAVRHHDESRVAAVRRHDESRIAAVRHHDESRVAAVRRHNESRAAAVRRHDESRVIDDNEDEFAVPDTQTLVQQLIETGARQATVTETTMEGNNVETNDNSN
jgi:hypothetical protein